MSEPESINPYQPVHRKSSHEGGVDSDGERLAFDGDVSESDLMDLIGTPASVIFTRALAVVAVGISVALVAGAIIVRQLSLLVPNATVITLFAIGVLVFLFSLWGGSKRRIRRIVREHSGAIGRLRGHLDASGVTLFRERERQWQRYSWAAFPDCVVNQSGVLLDWLDADGSFLGIPRHAIDGFEVEPVRKMLERYRSESTGPAVLQAVADWTLRPQDAVGFVCFMDTQNTVSWPQRLLLTLSRSGGWIAVGVIIGSMASGLPWLFVAVATVVLILLPTLQSRVEALVQGDRFALGAWGWMSDRSVTFHAPGRVYEIRWDSVDAIEVGQADLKVSLPEGGQVCVRAEDLVDERGQPIDDGGKSWARVIRFVDG